MSGPPRAYPLAVGSDLEPDGVAGPDVRYGEDGVLMDYVRRDGGWARVVFDRWDSLRVSRGEHQPYPLADPDSPWTRLCTVRPSPYLLERHAYESRFYRGRYSFNNDVDEMLEEFEHYLFLFHDEFVEVVAAGVHFDRSVEAPQGVELKQRPGWADLPESAIAQVWECAGIRCQVRVDPRPVEEIVKASNLCDQAMIQIALELDGRASVGHRLSVRTRGEKTVSRWRGYFGAVERPVFAGVPALDEIRPFVEAHAAEVRARRRAMGKS